VFIYKYGYFFELYVPFLYFAGFVFLTNCLPYETASSTAPFKIVFTSIPLIAAFKLYIPPLR